MSHHFFCELADQALRRLITKVVSVISLIVLAGYFL